MTHVSLFNMLVFAEAMHLVRKLPGFDLNVFIKGKKQKNKQMVVK